MSTGPSLLGSMCPWGSVQLRGQDRLDGEVWTSKGFGMTSLRISDPGSWNAAQRWTAGREGIAPPSTASCGLGLF